MTIGVGVTIGIIVAMEEEVAVLRDRHFDSCQSVGTLSKLFLGHLKGTEVILGHCGIGKVNAAMAASEIIARFDPGVLVVSGLAGALDPSLRAGDVVVASAAIQHDFDLRPILRHPGVVPGYTSPAIKASEKLVNIASQAATRVIVDRHDLGLPLATMRVGTVASGDAIITAARRKAMIVQEFPGVICVDMETAAVAQVARARGCDWVGVRVISDQADETFDLAQVMTFAIQEGGAIIAGLIEALCDLH